MVRLAFVFFAALIASCLAAPGERVRRYYHDGGLGEYGGGFGGGGYGGHGGHGGHGGLGFGQWPSASQSFSKSSASSSSVSSGGSLSGKK